MPNRFNRRNVTKGQLIAAVEILEEQLRQASVKFGIIEYNLSLKGLTINRETFAIEEAEPITGPAITLGAENAG